MLLTAKKYLKFSLSKALKACACNLCLKIPEINKKFIHKADKTLNVIKSLLFLMTKAAN